MHGICRDRLTHRRGRFGALPLFYRPGLVLRWYPGVLLLIMGKVVEGRRGGEGYANRGWQAEARAMSSGLEAPPPSASLPQYYIADGVHRAVAARENRLRLIKARLIVAGGQDQLVYVSPDQLHSPKPSISRAVTARRNYPALEAALATAAGRAGIQPIEIQPLGAPGQSASVPLGQVQILP